MTTAEQLRIKMANNFPIAKEKLIKDIVSGIECRGYRSYICDRHIRETSLDGLGTITMRDEEAAKTIATSEGFSWHYDYNNYGVRKIVFTL